MLLTAVLEAAIEKLVDYLRDIIPGWDSHEDEDEEDDDVNTTGWSHLAIGFLSEALDGERFFLE